MYFETAGLAHINADELREMGINFKEYLTDNVVRVVGVQSIRLVNPSIISITMLNGTFWELAIDEVLDLKLC